jgi:hypothetical protein
MVLLPLSIVNVTVVQKVPVCSSQSDSDEDYFTAFSESKGGGSNSSTSRPYKVALGEDSITILICTKPVNQQLRPSKTVDRKK